MSERINLNYLESRLKIRQQNRNNQKRPLSTSSECCPGSSIVSDSGLGDWQIVYALDKERKMLLVAKIDQREQLLNSTWAITATQGNLISFP